MISFGPLISARLAVPTQPPERCTVFDSSDQPIQATDQIPTIRMNAAKNYVNTTAKTLTVTTKPN